MLVEWRTLSTGINPVPTSVPSPVSWMAAFVTAPLVVGVLNLADGHSDPLIDLVVMTALAALLGVRARFAAGPGTAIICWLFLNGFGAPPMGELSWAGGHDLTRLVCLLLGVAGGTAIDRLTMARAAYRRITPACSDGTVSR
ncbi:hypothetical protein GCM10009730_61770 [Streptomyces albidochromogenes]|uniref:hypothetical protein n=1 Tax=Streptomyces albidochromogenes TaxID=329524 RepID=UPI00110F7CFA|nr:hypothetical protein [Streptomyces albidochromogenes]